MNMLKQTVQKQDKHQTQTTIFKVHYDDVLFP